MRPQDEKTSDKVVDLEEYKMKHSRRVLLGKLRRAGFLEDDDDDDEGKKK